MFPSWANLLLSKHHNLGAGSLPKKSNCVYYGYYYLVYHYSMFFFSMYNWCYFYWKLERWKKHTQYVIRSKEEMFPLWLDYITVLLFLFENDQIYTLQINIHKTTGNHIWSPCSVVGQYVIDYQRSSNTPICLH